MKDNVRSGNGGSYQTAFGDKDKPPGREKARAPLRAVFDANVYVAAYLSRNP